MKQPRSQSGIPASPKSLDKPSESFTPNQPSLFSSEQPPTPGSLNDEGTIRELLTSTIRANSKSREQIVEEMSRLLGDKVTVRMLNSYTSEAAEQHRWPMQYTRAFCYVVQDWSLLRCIVERANFRMITPAEADLLEYGREMLRQKQSAEKAALLERRLQGIDL